MPRPTREFLFKMPLSTRPFSSPIKECKSSVMMFTPLGRTLSWSAMIPNQPIPARRTVPPQNSHNWAYSH